MKSPVDQKVAIDQVERLASQSVVGMISTVIIATVLAAFLFNNVPVNSIMTWWSLMMLITAVRACVHIINRKGPLSGDTIKGRKRFFLISLFLSGCVWGSAAIILFPSAPLIHQVFITFVLGGMVAGSVGTFASVMETFYVYSIPTLLPLIVVFLSTGLALYQTMAFLTGLFWFFAFLSAKRINRDFLRFLMLKYENIDLIVDLEHEVKERRDAEEKLLVRNQQIESIVEERTWELLRVNEKLFKEIEERAEAEGALRVSEKKFQELANSLPQVVFETDHTGRIILTNRKAYELFGYTEEEFVEGLNVSQILHFDRPGIAESKLNGIMNGNDMDGEEFPARRKDGTLFPVAVHATAVDAGGKTSGIRGILIDLTESKKAKEEQLKLTAQLNRAQKMELLGTMAGGVAHDLNNILSGIVSYPDLLLLQIPSDSPLREPIQTMKKSGIRAAAMVQDLLTLTRRGVVYEEVQNLNYLIEEYLKSPEHAKLLSFHEKVVVETDLESDLLNVMGSGVHLTKTIMNLVSNAAEAMPQGGVLCITTRNCYLDRPLKGYDAIEKGDYAVLVVQDFGIGISEGDIERIFEPFYTKKVMGRSGTGLGMAVVWGTVKDHRGYIDVESVLDKGTTFSLYFPVTRQSFQVHLDQAPIAQYMGKGETVLVIDDVEEQRTIASEMLTLLGYSVTVASCGEEAIAYLQNQDADLLVLDMIMEPGMDGMDTYRKIVEMKGRQRAIIASGYSETERVREARRLGAGAYIKKPYTLIKLGQLVKAELEKGRESEFQTQSS